MTSVKFLADENGLYGFEISGHSSRNGDDEIGKIVCSAVSSAAYMAANTITEIIGDKADAVVDEAVMRFKVLNPSEASKVVLKGLELHLRELSDDYSNNIKIYGGANYVKD
ncbi:MAG: ribosomal-processing cysteine protease Prp [Ruminococcaceae bacterium]|nr:ribosomal-processing cysteine protease Prp [Oscillospiraceae bacterium]